MPDYSYVIVLINGNAVVAGVTLILNAGNESLKFTVSGDHSHLKHSL
jgi:hypothetical protein